jgi:hypothetical protein
MVPMGDNGWAWRFNDATPGQLLLKVMTKEILAEMVHHTNSRITEEEGKLTYGELLIFLSLHIGMVLQKLPRENLYWKTGTEGTLVYPNFG